MAATTTKNTVITDALDGISFENHETTVSKTSVIVSDLDMYYINIYMNFIFCGGLSVFGAVNNILNMITFRAMGLKNSMNIGLMVLSFTDFLLCLLTLMRIIFFVSNILMPDARINPLAINGVSVGYQRDILFLCSSWIMAFLSVERCVCVVFPFKVKAIFTKFRSIVILVTIYVINWGLHMPILVTHWLEWGTMEVPTANGTVFKERLVIGYSKNRRQMQLFIDIANGAVLPIPCQVIVLVSVAWMIYGLKMSSKIRNPNSLSDKEESQDKKQSNLSSKERRLVKVVLFLSIILTFCNIPRFLAVYAKQIFPFIAYQSAEENLYLLLWNIPIAASSINSSINIVVYLLVNKSYRQKFKDTFFMKQRSK